METFQKLNDFSEKRLRQCFRILAVLAVFAPSVFALDNGLARTPPMGWNSWNWFGCRNQYPGHGQLNEQMVHQMADTMVGQGLKAVGFEFINLDDCWGNPNRTATGGLATDASLFPAGMKALCNYVHNKGLKLGIYTDAWNATCANNIRGMYGREDQDADTFVAWGIDYVKVDNCYRTFQDNDPNIENISRTQYVKIREALKNAVTRAKANGNANARPIVYSICNWGWGNVNTHWGDTVGNLWRIGGDISIAWDEFWVQINTATSLYNRARPGAWNDPDMLEVGNGLTANEDRVHFTVWCMLAAPLIAGNDLRSMNAATKTLMTNREIILVNQDSLGSQGRVVSSNANQIVFSKKMKDGGYAVLYVNKATSAATISCTWQTIGTADPAGTGLAATKSMYGRNLFTHADMGPLTGSYSTSVPGHDCFLFRLSNSTTGTIDVHKQLSNGIGGFTIRQENGNIILNPGTIGAVAMSIVNLQGAIVRSTQMCDAPWVISRNGIRAGMYFVKLATDKGTISQKVLIK